MRCFRLAEVAAALLEKYGHNELQEANESKVVAYLKMVRCRGCV